MSKVRSELQDYPITPRRKQAILTGIGASVWRALKSGAVQAGKALGRLLHELIQRLREANRIGESIRSWSSWSGWCVREIITLQRAKLARDEASARFSAQIRREKEETKGSVKAFLSEVGAGSLREYLQGLTEGEGCEKGGKTRTNSRWGKKHVEHFSGAVSARLRTRI